MSNDRLCAEATLNGTWRSTTGSSAYLVALAKRRGLSCGIGKKVKVASSTYSSNASTSQVSSSLPACPSGTSAYWNNCFGSGTFSSGNKYVGEFKGGDFNGQGTFTFADGNKYVGEFKGGDFNGQGTVTFADGSKYVGEFKGGDFNGQGTYTFASGSKYVGEFKGGDFNGQGAFIKADGSVEMEGVWKDDEFQYAKKLTPSSSTTQIASSTTTQANTTTSAELEAERLRKELAALKAKHLQVLGQLQQKTISSSDTRLPTISIASASTKGKQGLIRGKARDNIGIAEVNIDGKQVGFDNSGNFEFETFVPVGGKEVTIQVTDLNGLSNSKTVKLDRTASSATTAITFESLNPLGRKVAKNTDALALIIGVDSYENTPARAIYADKDAQVFADYATEKLGIPANRIKTLVNNGAGERELLLSVRSWLSRASKQGESDVYIFFAGHGLASDDGQKMYLLPYDGAPELLDDTAILRDRLFSDIASANPRSVTVFLDTCYSGTTRGTDMLIASRPIAIKALEQSVPDNFTVMTAARGDQTAKPLEEAKHGMFSYFLMKGMEGEADKNQDNKITAGELHQYVQNNVVQQSSGSQTPELQGDAERVLVRFQ